MSLSRALSICATLFGIGIVAAFTASGDAATVEGESDLTGDSWKDRAKLDGAYSTLFRNNRDDLHWFRDVPLGEPASPSFSSSSSRT